MDTFKIYLPSNVCGERFPNNTATDYHTQLARPLELSGEWQVGVESIFSSAVVYDSNEIARINFNLSVRRSEYVNDEEVRPFRLTNIWPGYDGATPNSIEENSANIANILKCLNSLNYDILRGGDQFLFQFTQPLDDKVIYQSNNPHFSLKVTPIMAKILGYETYNHIFTGDEAIHARRKPVALDRKLKADDYDVCYFARNLVKLERRIILKAKDEGGRNVKQKLLAAWNTFVSPLYYLTIKFSKSQKLIITNKHDNVALFFSNDFKQRFKHRHPLIYSAEFWSVSQADLLSDVQGEEWYVDIYSDKLEGTHYVESYDSFFEFKLHLFDNIDDLLHTIHRKGKKMIAETLEKMKDKRPFLSKDDYQSMYMFEMLIEGDFCQLAVGSEFRIEFSDNVRKLFGFEETIYTNTMQRATYALSSFAYRQERLFILMDCVGEVYVGNQRVRTLQDFLQQPKDYSTMERRFFPINYIPLSKSYIDAIHIQITNDQFKPVTIRESNTIVVLHFQRVK